MIFKGEGIVKWKDRVIAVFQDGKFETNDPAIIQRLKLCDFPEYVPEPEATTPSGEPPVDQGSAQNAGDSEPQGAVTSGSQSDADPSQQETQSVEPEATAEPVPTAASGDVQPQSRKSGRKGGVK